MKTNQRFQSRSSLAAFVVLAAMLAQFAAPSAQAATSTWVGGYVNTGVWSQPTQWAEGVEPASGNDIIFNNIAGNNIGTSINEARTVKSITFNGGSPSPAFTIRLANNNSSTAYNLTFQSGNTGITVAAADTAAHTIGMTGTSIGNVVLGGGLTVTHNGSGILTINRPITGAFAVTKAGTGTLTLSATNTYSGVTTISAGTLSVGSLALQNSRLDTTASLAGDATNGLKTAATTLTLGGLTGNKNLADVFTTTTGGYSGVTDLTLNPGSGVSASYSGSIANGADGMTLTKSGVGTQILSGIHTYTGNTTINNGRLQGVVGGSLASANVILNDTTATNSVSITDNTKGWTNAAFTATAAGVLEFNFGAVTPSTNQAPYIVSGQAAFDVTPTVRVIVPLGTAAGTYPLITWGSTSGTPPTTAELTLVLVGGGNGTLSTNDNTLNLQFAPNVKADNFQDLTNSASWTVGVPASTDVTTWDSTVTTPNTTSLGADTTWAGLRILDPNGLVTINSGNTLTLGAAAVDIDLSKASTNLTLNCDVALGAANVWSVTNSQTLTVAGGVSGSGTLTKQGAGTVILSGANTYTNATTISAGTLQLGANDVLPDGTGKGNVTVTGTLDLNSFSDTVNGLSGAGTVDNSAASTASTLTVGGNNASSTFSGVIQNSGSSATNNLIKIGTGTLTLSGSNTFSGTATVSRGTLSLAHVSALSGVSGIMLGTNTTLSTSTTGITLGAPITLDASGTNAAIAFSRDAADPGTLTLNGGIGGAGDLIFTTPNVNSGGNIQTILLGAPGIYSGDTTLDTGNTGNALTVKAETNNVLPTTTVLTLDGGNGSGSGRAVTFDLNGFDQTLAGLTNIQGAAQVARNQRVSNSGALATLTITNSVDYTYGTPGLTNTFNSNLIRPTALITGALALTKQGAGTLTLVSANTYTGDTTISGGTLALGSVTTGAGITSIGTINSSTNLIVGTEPGSAAILDVTAAGMTLGAARTLKGHGTVNGAITVNGTVAPGTSVGTLTLNGNVVLNASSTNTFEVDGSTPTNDVIVLGAAVTYGGVLNIVPTGTFTNGQTFELFSGAGAASASNFGSLVVNPTVSGISFTFTNGVLTAVVTSGPSGPATLTNSYSGGSLSLSWPAGEGWRLQMQTNSLAVGLFTNWTYITDGSISSTNITPDSTLPTAFYRLMYP